MVVNREVSQPRMPIFTGKKYEFWSIKIKTLLKSQETWKKMEVGFVDQVGADEEADGLKWIKNNDAKELFLIQESVHDIVFSRIVTTTTSAEAWRILKKESQGSAKVLTVKLQTYHRDFKLFL